MATEPPLTYEGEPLLIKLKSAVHFVKNVGHLTQNAMIPILNDRRGKLSSGKLLFTAPKLSRYLKATEYGPGINSATARQFILCLDEYIENVLKFKWDDNEGYVSIEIIGSPSLNQRLETLIGVWKAYTYDADNSRVHKKPFIHAFKLLINGHKDIDCETQEASFKGGIMMPVNNEKIGLELGYPGRKILMVINIGSAQLDFLKKVNEFHFAYVDSGDRKIKAGLGIMERTLDDFDSIKPKSHLLWSPEIPQGQSMANLEGKQLIPDDVFFS